MDKLYGFESFFEIGEIKEWNIVKETPKTYIVQPQGGGWERTVKKNEMSVGQATFATTYDEAVKAKRDKIVRRIESKNAEIKRRELEISKLQQQLKELNEK